VDVKRILIDTNVYTAFKTAHRQVTRQLQISDEIHLNITVLAELIAGFKAGSKEALNREELRAFMSSPRMVLDEITEATAEFYAHICLMLRIKRTPIPANDMWIAASAMQHGCALYSLDRHFAAVDGLLLVQAD
jgi:tRNA(fMet)-specific endonuclease VapC